MMLDLQQLSNSRHSSQEGTILLQYSFRKVSLVTAMELTED